MPVKLNNFQETNTFSLADYLVGYTNTSPGGERRWSLNSVKNWLYSLVRPSITAPKILAYGSVVKGADTSVSGAFTISEPGWLLAVGNATANYTGRLSNAGNYAFLYLNNGLIATDMSFEGESSSISFYSNCIGMAYVAPGTHSLRLDHQVTTTNVGSTRRVSAWLNWAVFPVLPNTLS